MKFILDMVKALFGLFVLTFLYVLFFVDTLQKTVNNEENKTISMEEAINLLDKNITTKEKNV